MEEQSICILLISVLLACTIIDVEAIGCFVCTSINHKEPECEDMFNNTGKYYQDSCWAPRKGRIGKFPGTKCIKMIAEDESTKYSVVVRDCVVDDGGTNSETEIGRQSHCGWMRVLKFNDKTLRGCILNCDKDACNHGNRVETDLILSLVAAVTLLILFTKRLS
ncbi:hypothetical protein BgiMline_001500 [Biomphalaria glabrata]|uniref:Uncharacterized protein LOC106079409 n=1 Tax=Biomphalaria glabrata TaxID=6526 RepID=A0A2C9K341_BIOGL|nr:uncharacterized protein LOC106079409 [Biomphalaria glabrata]XP_055900607.1 uncharacterized protein LOC106079409 [Biomphalaria glabrata]XP_055900613.1 uncharacterized protein LOC106079409 [Biomphalaria glabrata]XP_055900621.1 uncharacterized protein LOC106079409 [Biomphalaria glabrata]KAI8769370.1 CAunnamed protein product [Biomphalaria glabrata]KAI8789692.1 CAunnamed protein product [Biomphalaria glabrata]